MASLKIAQLITCIKFRAAAGLRSGFLQCVNVGQCCHVPMLGGRELHPRSFSTSLCRSQEEKVSMKDNCPMVNPDDTEIIAPGKKETKVSKKRRTDKNTELVKLPKQQIDSVNEIASIVISLREIACVTMSRGLTVTSWKNYPVSASYRKKSQMSKIENYYQDVSRAADEISLQGAPDLFIMEERFWRLSVPFMSSHFLIVKSIMHSLLSYKHAKPDHRVVTYANWGRTGKIFDLYVEGNSRKSGKEKVTEIFREGSWLGNHIELNKDLIKVTDSGVKIHDHQLESGSGDYPYKPMTEEMADAFLQALGFWSTYKPDCEV